MHIITGITFSTASVTVFSFVRLYTVKVSDADYIQPLFGIIIIAAEALYCWRLPYYSIIYAAGKFRETNRSAYIEAAVNIITSIVLVCFFGIIGVAIGTLLAMLYRTVAYIIFLSKDVLSLRIIDQIKRYIITIGIYVTCIFLCSRIHIEVNTYFSWILYAGMVFILISIYTFLLNLLLDRKNTTNIILFFCKKNKKAKAS